MDYWLLIDRYLRILVLLSIAIFAFASAAIGIWSNQPAAIIIGVTAWGLTFGGAATLLQTAIAHAGGRSADIAQSMLVTAWNLGIGAGGMIGAILLHWIGARFLPGSLVLLLFIALLITLSSKKHGFPSSP